MSTTTNSGGDGIELSDEKTYKNAEELERLYHDAEMSQRDIADVFDVSQETIRRWMSKHNIEARDRIEATRQSDVGRPRIERASHRLEIGEYETWKVTEGEQTVAVRVHQLLACLDHDPHAVFADDTTHVHHRAGSGDGGKLLNLPANLEVVSVSEHRRLHERGKRVSDPELPCEVISLDQ